MRKLTYILLLLLLLLTASRISGQRPAKTYEDKSTWWMEGHTSGVGEHAWSEEAENN